MNEFASQSIFTLFFFYFFSFFITFFFWVFSSHLFFLYLWLDDGDNQVRSLEFFMLFVQAIGMRKSNPR